MQPAPQRHRSHGQVSCQFFERGELAPFPQCHRHEVTRTADDFQRILTRPQPEQEIERRQRFAIGHGADNRLIEKGSRKAHFQLIRAQQQIERQQLAVQMPSGEFGEIECQRAFQRLADEPAENGVEHQLAVQNDDEVHFFIIAARARI